jgi:hypothetical protein
VIVQSSNVDHVCVCVCVCDVDVGHIACVSEVLYVSLSSNKATT